MSSSGDYAEPGTRAPFARHSFLLFVAQAGMAGRTRRMRISSECSSIAERQSNRYSLFIESPPTFFRKRISSVDPPSRLNRTTTGFEREQGMSGRGYGSRDSPFATEVRLGAPSHGVGVVVCGASSRGVTSGNGRREGGRAARATGRGSAKETERENSVAHQQQTNTADTPRISLDHSLDFILLP